MVGLEEFTALSEKLLGYFEMIEKESGSRIVLRYIDRELDDPSEGADRFRVGVIVSDEAIELEVNREHGLSQVDLEHAMAHEATHGYLVNAKGYWRGYAKQHAHEKVVRELVSIACSIVDDIVVSKTMADNGLSPFSSTYLAEVKREMKDARKNPNYYPFYQEFPEFREHFIAFGYVLAWGYLKYIDLPAETKDLLTRFTKGIQNISLPGYKMAQQVTKAISRHDIFTSEGHKSALEEIILLWELENLVVLWDA